MINMALCIQFEKLSVYDESPFVSCGGSLDVVGRRGAHYGETAWIEIHQSKLLKSSQSQERIFIGDLSPVDLTARR